MLLIRLSLLASEPIPMDLLSRNWRGLGNLRIVQALNDLVRDHKPEALFLMDTIFYGSMIEN